MKAITFNLKAIVVCVIMVMTGACTSAYAEGTENYVANQVGNTRVVYSKDASGMYLTPKFKYVYTNPAANTEVKTALSWNENNDSWLPAYEITTVTNTGAKTMTYAHWNGLAQGYVTSERMIYQFDANNNLTSCQTMQWNNSAKTWIVK